LDVFDFDIFCIAIILFIINVAKWGGLNVHFVRFWKEDNLVVGSRNETIFSWMNVMRCDAMRFDVM